MIENHIIIVSTILKAGLIFVILALGVGFYTLIERKVLSYIQLRKGPNKVGLRGLPQPLADAAKLFTKESILVKLSNKPTFIGAPLTAILIIFILWNIYASAYGIRTFKLRILFFLAISRINVYAVLFSGWASNSKYSLLGAIRAMAQTISYEVRIALVILRVLILSITFNLIDIKGPQQIWFLFLLWPLATIWFIRSLAETNRAPFDLAEGESELVSGFNIEYGGGEFAFLFIAEYGRILLIRVITICLFIAAISEHTGIRNLIKLVTIAYLFLWIRGSYPRIRYDTLISLTWKTFLIIAIASIILTLTQWYFISTLSTFTFQVKRLL